MAPTRREFIRNTGRALGMATLATGFEHFGLINALAVQKSAPDTEYKALVCIYLDGGNDGNNTVIPNHDDSYLSNYASYNAARSPQGLALPRNTLLPIAVPRMGNLTYGLHPGLGVVNGGLNSGIYELWDQGKMAIVGNVGTLVRPITKLQFQDYTFPRPYQLFSHSDQASQFQAGRSDTGAFAGWGGKLSDRLSGRSNPNALVPMITSVNGAQLFTAGETTLSLAIADAEIPLDQVFRPEGFNGTTYSNARWAAFNQLRTVDLDSHYIAAASAITDQAIAANSALSSFQEVTTVFPDTSLGRQLKQVARLVKKRNDLNISRQIFYCQLNGFDHHEGQPAGQASLLTQFSQAVRSFYDEMAGLGLAGNVTTFTMSDFGRTFNPSGTGGYVGTDHGWANHMVVIGDAVLGGNFYGMNTQTGTPFPILEIDGPDDADTGPGARGRWIPTTSVEQYAATLARWYGLVKSDFPLVFPNIRNFTKSNLGFMQP